MGIYRDRILPHIIDRAWARPNSSCGATRWPPVSTGRWWRSASAPGSTSRRIPTRSTWSTPSSPPTCPTAGRAAHRCRPGTGGARRSRRPAHPARRRLVRRRTQHVHAVHHPRCAGRALRVAPVVRPGGRFHFLEHGLSPDAGRHLAAPARAHPAPARGWLPPHPRPGAARARCRVRTGAGGVALCPRPEAVVVVHRGGGSQPVSRTPCRRPQGKKPLVHRLPRSVHERAAVATFRLPSVGVSHASSS